ncbi:uncharacterized protein LOC103318100 [Nasonia vitripennis]|uniref:Uncharacterized protein n=1 Tax=Nasonia vitripennis TaxID=7425 RepID=A0A7M7HHJ6_NASVI|nr:uncharacterized protein LOC103318100 [Nasonia vitripennis]
MNKDKLSKIQSKKGESDSYGGKESEKFDKGCEEPKKSCEPEKKKEGRANLKSQNMNLIPKIMVKILIPATAEKIARNTIVTRRYVFLVFPILCRCVTINKPVIQWPSR